MAVITISRQIGSLGDELATYLASKLGCGLVDRKYTFENLFSDLEDSVKAQLQESAKFFLKQMSPDGPTYKDLLVECLGDIADESSNVIILGLGGAIALADRSDVISIRVTAGDESRIRRIAKQFGISHDEAQSTVTIGDRKHKRFVSALYDQDLDNANLYDLTFNTDKLSVEECAEAVLALIERRNNRLRVVQETTDNDSMDHQSQTPVFKNDTEAEFARILDMYNIQWMYEPKTFPIEWDAEGNITMAFSPDFYLPKFNLYLELTTMEQKYVTKKNKKARKVMELYPGTNVRIVYKKDFLELAERFRQFGG